MAREAMDRFNDELRQAGVRVTAAGLKPSEEARRVISNGSSASVVEGPFSVAEWIVSGFWIWEVRDMDQATQWALRCPNPMEGPYEIELRPLY